MTVTPTMTPKTSMTGVLLACVGAAALFSVLQMIEVPGSGGWRSTNTTPAQMTVPTQTRGNNGMEATAFGAAGDVSTVRGRN